MLPLPATIACVFMGEKYGAEYVEILHDMVRRNVKPDRELRFVCITDRPGELPEDVEAIEPEPGLPGWWQKLSLWKPGKLPAGRIAYFDLDVAITGELDTLIDNPGIIREWNGKGYNSSVMVWDEGDHAAVWADFTPEVMADLPGDQDFISQKSEWRTFPEAWCVSYKRHAVTWPPAHSRVIVFHGKPKPHEITDGWVPIVWKVGGLHTIPIHKGMNIVTEQAVLNFKHAIQRDMQWLTGCVHNPGECLIVGSAPSVRECVADIRKRHKRGGALVSMNGSLRWLLGKGMMPTSHVLLDGRPENIEFARDIPRSTKVFVASQCHPTVIDHLLATHPPSKVILWHAYLSEDENQLELLKPYDDTKPICLVGGGCTVGLRAISIATLAGFKRLHIFGMDSCYLDEEHHAFAQPLNDGEERTQIVTAFGRYSCSYWMAKQAQQFDDMHRDAGRMGVRIWAHGRGLIPDLCGVLNRQNWREAA